MHGLQEWLLSGASGSSSDPRGHHGTLEPEEREVIRRRMRAEKWTLDRGTGYYSTERTKRKLPCLVQTGKHAGRSRVRYVGVDFHTFWKHILRRDFFTTAVNAKLLQLVAMLVAWYFIMLMSWSTVYYLIWRWNNSCFIGFHGFRSAFMYATETQQTIGYGERATGECWISALMVSIHSLQAVLLDSVILGIVFSRISHPKQRSRTVLISDCACIARRDGQLKFMFRIADIQKRSVIDPRVRVVMYTWGPGRRTAEGERIPVTAQEVPVSLDRTLLLPATVEHDIDEASPLFGHNLLSMEAVGAEVVVTFEASTELGDTFMARQSYLPSEIHWGHTFVNIVRPAPSGDTQHEVDLSRFHDVEPQPALCDEMTHPHRLSRKVVAGGGASNVVPPRLLSENTLVLSEDAVVTCRNGRPYLMFRLGDTFPGQVLDVQVTAHLYRWQASHTLEGELLPYEEHPLELEPANLLLRYPVTLMHELDPARSPVAHWASQKGLRHDADAEVVVVARGTLYSRQQVITRTRVYSVLGDVKWGHAFLPVVLPGTTAGVPGASSKLGVAVDWSHFHATTPIQMPLMAGQVSPLPSVSPRQSQLGIVGVPADGAAGSSSAAPRTLPPAAAPHGASRLSQVRLQGLSPALLRSPERSASTGSLSAFTQHQQPHQQQALTVTFAPDVERAAAQAPQQGPELQRQASAQPQRPPLQRNPSAPHMALGGADLGRLRSASTTSLVAPGPSGLSRRTDDGSDDDSLADATSYGWGAPTPQPVSGAQRQGSGTAGTQADRAASEKTWHQTRSLFAALEGIQQHLEEEQQMQRTRPGA